MVPLSHLRFNLQPTISFSEILENYTRLLLRIIQKHLYIYFLNITTINMWIYLLLTMRACKCSGLGMTKATANIFVGSA